MKTRVQIDGFSLIEVAVVIFVLALILGGIAVPLSTQIEQRKIRETRIMLDEIKVALYGFAAAHGRLPCPDTSTDPAAVGYGEEEASCNSNPTAEGYLPWLTLGLPKYDAWGSDRTSASSARNGDWRYRVDRNFAVATFTLTTCTHANDRFAIVDSAGTSQLGTENCQTTPSVIPERPVAIVYSAGPNLVPDGQNASFEATNPTYQWGIYTSTFDDMLIWINRRNLLGAMIKAGSARN